MNKLITIKENEKSQVIELSNSISNSELENAFKVFEDSNPELAKQVRDKVKNTSIEVKKITNKKEFEETKSTIKSVNALQKEIKEFYEPKVKTFHQLHKDSVAIRDSKINVLKAIADNCNQSLHIFMKEKEEAERKIQEEKDRIQRQKEELEFKRKQAEQDRIEAEQNALNEKDRIEAQRKQEILNKEIEAKQKEEEAKEAKVLKATTLVEKFDTSGLKQRKTAKKFEYNIKQGKLVQAIQKIEKQGLVLDDYIKVTINKNKIKDLYNMNVLTDEELDVKEIETFTKFS